MTDHPDPLEPSPRTRARAFAVSFAGFATIVTIVIWFTGELVDLVDYLIVLGFPVAFGALAYFLGRHVSDEAVD